MQSGVSTKSEKEVSGEETLRKHSAVTISFIKKKRLSSILKVEIGVCLQNSDFTVQPRTVEAGTFPDGPRVFSSCCEQSAGPVII